jgi:hypothetical protein
MNYILTGAFGLFSSPNRCKHLEDQHILPANNSEGGWCFMCERWCCRECISFTYKQHLLGWQVNKLIEQSKRKQVTSIRKSMQGLCGDCFSHENKYNWFWKWLCGYSEF